MAVIKRKLLYDEAKDIADKGIKMGIANGNQVLVNLQQQREMISAQQQSQVQSVNNQINNIAKSIYQASRQQRAKSASLGYMGDIADLRDNLTIQDAATSELNSVIDQSEVNAINIAGQQNAINVAEVQTATNEIKDAYTDHLIDTGVAKQDIGRQILNGFTGALTGAIKGLIGGKIVSSSTKTLLNPASGMFKKGLAAAGLYGVANFAVNDMGKMVNVGNENYGDGRTLYNEKRGQTAMSHGMLTAGLLGMGATALGAKLGKKGGLLDTALQAKFLERRSNMAKSSLFKAAATKGGGVFAKMKGAMKMNPWVAAASAGIGAIIGGVSAGMKKKYKLDMNDIIGTDTYNQFSDFGLDLSDMSDIVKNR